MGSYMYMYTQLVFSDIPVAPTNARLALIIAAVLDIGLGLGIGANYGYLLSTCSLHTDCCSCS